MRKTQLRGAFTELEQAIMEIVWRLGGATSDQVRQILDATRPLKESTVRTVLSRLEDKGHLRHTVSGRTFVYFAAEPSQNLAIRAVRQIVDRFCAGSVEQLLMGMVSHDLIDPRQLELLAGKIAKSRATKPKGEAK